MHTKHVTFAAIGLSLLVILAATQLRGYSTSSSNQAVPSVQLVQTTPEQPRPALAADDGVLQVGLQLPITPADSGAGGSGAPVAQAWRGDDDADDRDHDDDHEDDHNEGHDEERDDDDE